MIVIWRILLETKILSLMGEHSLMLKPRLGSGKRKETHHD